MRTSRSIRHAGSHTRAPLHAIFPEHTHTHTHPVHLIAAGCSLAEKGEAQSFALLRRSKLTYNCTIVTNMKPMLHLKLAVIMSECSLLHNSISKYIHVKEFLLHYYYLNLFLSSNNNNPTSDKVKAGNIDLHL